MENNKKRTRIKMVKGELVSSSIEDRRKLLTRAHYAGCDMPVKVRRDSLFLPRVETPKYF